MKPIPFSCFRSIFFKRNPNSNPLSDSASETLFVPDDVMIFILNRLDVRDVVRCRCVCKRWKDLTSTPQFLDSFLLMPISNLPMILHRIHKKASVELFCIDKWWGTKPSIHNIGCDYFVNTGRNQPLPYCSQNGFTLTCYPELVLTHCVRNIMVGPKEYTIRNPLTHEQVKIVLHGKPDAAGVHDIFGIFLHPIRKEYCTLWRVQESSDHHYRTQYKMLNLGLGSSNCWRNIGDIWSHSHCWVARSSIVCLDGFVYWMVYYDDYGFDKHVMAFDIKTEEFTPMSLPCSEGDNFSNTNLLNADGFLSLVRVIFNNPHDEVITIKKWTLKDHQTRFWTASGEYVLSQRECPQVICKLMILMAVAIVNSELVMEGILEDKVGLFVYNLESGAIRNFSKNNYSWDARFWAHQPSIASLRNCQPVIHINV